MNREAVHVLIAPDSFKGTLSADAVADAMAQGIKKADPTALVESVPLSDGGEGFVDCIARAVRGQWVRCEVHDPLMRPIHAEYFVSHDGIAYIEMARASGLGLLAAEERDPKRTTTYGTGEMILDALRRGCRRVVVGLGGSATSDGGAGMLSALGWRLYDRNDRLLPPGGLALQRLSRIDDTAVHPDIRKTQFVAACDVDNPLLGPQGAVYVYGSQKAAPGSTWTPEPLERAMRHWAKLVRHHIGKDYSQSPFAGAAGGTAFALMSFLAAEAFYGIDFIMNLLSFDTRLRRAHLLITGEGKVDAQTRRGKVVYRVVQKGKEASVPTVVVAGQREADIDWLYALGARAVFALVPPGVTLDLHQFNTFDQIAQWSFDLYRLFSFNIAHPSKEGGGKVVEK